MTAYTPILSLREALNDPQLLGGAFPGDSWGAWRALLIAAMGEPLSEEERAIFKRLTGRAREPGRRVEELHGIIGRRGGKDRAASVLVAYLSVFVDWSPKLAPGERGLVVCIGADQSQATVTRNYIEGAFRSSVVLSGLIESTTADTISLRNGIDIEVRSAHFRRLRGFTAVAVIATETAFWASDQSSNPDHEILQAIRPTLSTTGGPLICITSPYARRGEAWEVWRKHYGETGDPLILVAHAPSRETNPTLPESVVQRALERDHAAARAEYLAQFRTDIEAFISREAVEAVTQIGVRERAPLPNVRYSAFCDPSGGSSDSMTLAIGHLEEGRVALDCVREVRAPFSPQSAVQDFAEILKRYRLRRVTGDRYAGEWPAEAFRQHGVEYQSSPLTKSELYRELLPLINAGECALLDDGRLIAQLSGLERKTARGGRESIDHAPGAHDDLANAVAGVLVTATKPTKEAGWGTFVGFGYGETPPVRTQNRSWRRGTVISAIDGRRIEKDRVRFTS